MIYPIKKRITKIETINATSIPTIKIKNSINEKLNPKRTIFNKLAPNITGIAKKNVNSAATVLDTPIIKPPTMVAPERDVPGEIAAINWKTPIMIASLYVICDNVSDS